MPFIRQSAFAVLFQLDGDENRRRRGDINLTDLAKTDFLQPRGHLLECVRVAVVRVDEHVDREKQGIWRSRAVVVGNELGDGDDAAGGERVEDLFEKVSGTRFAFAVEDVAEGGDVKARSKIHFLNIAFDCVQPIGEVLPLGDATRDRQDGVPIDGGDLRLREPLGHAEAPDAGAGRDVENIDLAGGKLLGQLFGQRTGRSVVQVEQTFDEFAEELGSLILLVDGGDGFARANDFGEMAEIVEKLIGQVQAHWEISRDWSHAAASATMA